MGTLSWLHCAVQWHRAHAGGQRNRFNGQICVPQLSGGEKCLVSAYVIITLLQVPDLASAVVTSGSMHFGRAERGRTAKTLQC